MAKAPKPTTTRRRSATRAEGIASDAAPAPAHLSQYEIALRAFELYCARGGQHGRDLEDWLQAERELLNGQRQSYHGSSLR
jgi:hypothetical protein